MQKKENLELEKHLNITKLELKQVELIDFLTKKVLELQEKSLKT